MIGEVSIRPGDLVVGDRDGLVVIPQPEIIEVLTEAEKRDQKESWVKELRNWDNTPSIFLIPVQFSPSDTQSTCCVGSWGLWRLKY